MPIELERIDQGIVLGYTIEEIDAILSKVEAYLEHDFVGC